MAGTNHQSISLHSTDNMGFSSSILLLIWPLKVISVCLSLVCDCWLLNKYIIHLNYNLLKRLYHFVHTILSNTILSVYHFVQTIFFATILSGNPIYIMFIASSAANYFQETSQDCLLRPQILMLEVTSRERFQLFFRQEGFWLPKQLLEDCSM